jgi:integrase
MARRRLAIPTRTAWHQSPSGCWSLSLGERGCRVRVTQKVKGGDFFRETWLPGHGRTQASLKTPSRVVARQLAEEFLRSLTTPHTAPPEASLTLGALWSLYRRESTQYRQNTPRTQKEKDARMTLLLLGLGAQSRVDRLTISDCERYAELRRRGTGWPDQRITPAVRARTVGHDFQTLRAVIRWACTVRKPDGAWLVQENPLRGLRVPKESNVRRPLATHDRFLAVRAAAQQLAATVNTEHERVKWARLELALLLAEATGRRVGAIRGLRWADFDMKVPSIT